MAPPGHFPLENKLEGMLELSMIIRFVCVTITEEGLLIGGDTAGASSSWGTDPRACGQDTGRRVGDFLDAEALPPG